MTAALKKVFSKPYDNVSAHEAAQMVANGAILLDVRAPYEWQAGHAPKARHIPLAQLHQRAHELPVGRPTVTVCRSGARSASAAAMLARDSRPVSNLAGGMRAWMRAQLPVIAKGGSHGLIG